MRLLDICAFLDNPIIYNENDAFINNVASDTRKIKKGDCYIGIKGEKFDGNKMYMEAFKNGAVVSIIEKCEISKDTLEFLHENNLCILMVDDTIKALGAVASLVRKNFNKPVVAVTGSAGKTSTKDMIYSVLSTTYNTHKTIGNQNNHIGLPLSILSLDEKNEIMVLEMGMNHLGEISYLTNIAKPTVAVITNVGTAHIGNLGSRENILKAKLEILEGLPKDGVVIINNDNDLLHDWYLKNNDLYHIVTVGINSDSDFLASNITLDEMSTKFICNNEEYVVPTGGEPFIYNALETIAVASIFNIPIENVKKGILDFKLSSNRMSILERNGITIIDDSYNANYDSMKYAIKFLSSLHGRNIAVLGSMLELGNYSRELHQDIGKIVFDENIDILVTIGSDAKYIYNKAIELGFKDSNCYYFDNNRDAIKLINSIKKENDNILIKASNSMNFKEIVENIK